MDKEDIKELISLCSSFEEADFIISEYGDFNSTKEKKVFLKEFFQWKSMLIRWRKSTKKD